MNSSASQINSVKTISYGGFKSQVFLWQKSLLLVPIWAIILVPLLGLLFRAINPALVQPGLGLMVACFAAYLFEDVLKRKIRIDDDHIYFGYRAIKIQDLIAVDLAYKKGKLLPRFITLQSDTGPALKLTIDGLSDRNVETLLKTLQSRNSRLKTTPVLSTLLKCRRTSKKVATETEHLELPYHTRKVFGEAYETFVTTAHKWVRVGPLLSFFLFGPFWLQFLTQLYTFLQRNSFLAVDKLDVHQFLYHLMSSLQQHSVNAISDVSVSAAKFSEHAPVAIAALAFILAVLAYLWHVLLRPNALVADGTGIKLGLRAGYLFMPLSKVRWTEIDTANLRKGRDATLHSWKLQLKKKNGKDFNIRLGAIDPDDRTRLLRRMEERIPACTIEPELAQAMLPNADRSYTEIWLQSLSQAPERKTLDPLAPGQLVGDEKFEVVKKLGVGGQGTAYLCRDLFSGETVVLKETILPVFVEEGVRRAALERFENEARLLKSAVSESTVALLDYFIEDHRAYLVLEHIDGLSMRDLVARDGAIEESRVLDLALQMTDMLQLLHEQNIVHRDFTPDNLILNSRGRLKLIDFNVAQQLQAGTSGTIVGKHAYLPPEQFRGKATTQSDLYACGATLFYLLTGVDPEPISQSSPTASNESVSSHLNEVVKKATALQTNKRYQTAQEMKADLLQFESEAVVLQVPQKEAVDIG